MIYDMDISLIMDEFSEEFIDYPIISSIDFYIDYNQILFII